MPDEKEKVEPEVIDPVQIQPVQPEAHELQQAPKNELSAESLIAQAITNGTPVDTMERLLAMRRELRAERAKELFDADMAKFQGACPVINKTKAVKTKSGQTAYKYAPLDTIVAQVKDLLNEYNFSYSIQTETLDGKVKVTCITKHKAGHSESNSVEVPLGTKTDIMSNTQVVAAALTFAKRYAFCNAFGILTGDDDDDAVSTKAAETPQNGARANYPSRSSNQSATPPKTPQAATDEQKRRIFALGKELGQTPEGTKEGVKKVLKLDSFTSITFDDAARMIRALDKKVKSLPPKETVTGENAEELVKEVFEVEDDSGEVVTA